MSIEHLKFVADKDIFLEYIKENAQYFIPFSALLPYWSYATAGDFEGGSAKVIDDCIVGFLLTASGQGGLVFVWDTLESKIIHASDGAYAIAATIYKNMVYCLCCITNYVTRAHFALFRSKIAADTMAESEPIDYECACNINDYNGDFASIKLEAEDGHLSVVLNSTVYPIVLKESN